jgi:hypothetical protein
MLHRCHGRYPYKLWSLTSSPNPAEAARSILEDPRCLLDEFSKEFIDRYGPKKNHRSGDRDETEDEGFGALASGPSVLFGEDAF